MQKKKKKKKKLAILEIRGHGKEKKCAKTKTSTVSNGGLSKLSLELIRRILDRLLLNCNEKTMDKNQI